MTLICKVILSSKIHILAFQKTKKPWFIFIGEGYIDINIYDLFSIYSLDKLAVKVKGNNLVTNKRQNWIVNFQIIR